MFSALTFHSTASSSCFVTVMKSGPKNTARTPSMRNSSFAKGLQNAELAVGKSRVPPLAKTWKINKYPKMPSYFIPQSKDEWKTPNSISFGI